MSQGNALLVKIIDKIDLLSSDVSLLKSDMSGLKTDVSGLKADMLHLRGDMTEVKGDVKFIKEVITEFTTDLDSHEVRIKALEKSAS